MDAAVVFVVVFVRNKPNRRTLDETGLNRVPRLICAGLYGAFLINLCNLRLEREALRGGLTETDSAYRLIGLVVQQ